MITNPEILAKAVCDWGMSEDNDDEADIALEKVLVDQGVIKPGDDVYFSGNHVGIVHVFINGNTIIQIDQDGNVERF